MRYGILSGNYHDGPTPAQFEAFVFAAGNALRLMGKWQRSRRGRPPISKDACLIGAYAMRVYGFTAGTARAYLLDQGADRLWSGEDGSWAVPTESSIRDEAREITARDLRRFGRLFREFWEIDGRFASSLPPGVRPLSGAYRPARMRVEEALPPPDDATVTQWLVQWAKMPPVARLRGISRVRVSSTPRKGHARAQNLALGTATTQ